MVIWYNSQTRSSFATRQSCRPGDFGMATSHRRRLTVSDKDGVYHDFSLPIGSIVHANLCTMNRDFEVHPEQEAFNADRWLIENFPLSSNL